MKTSNKKLFANAFVATEGILKNNGSEASGSKATLVNISFGPSLKTGVKGQGKVGDRVQLLDKIKPSGDSLNWYKIRYYNGSDDTGWIRENLVDVKLVHRTPPDPSTLVFFVTNSKSIRIYQNEGAVYINVYDNRRKITELRSVPTVRVPQLDANSKWKSYIALKDGYSYYVRFVPFATVELIISSSFDGAIVSRENGFRPSGTEYQTNP